MMSKDTARRLIVFLTCLTSVLAFAEDSVVPPDEFVYCTVCHGVDLMGNPIIEAPRLSGMAASYVERQLRAFKDGTRGKHEADTAGIEMQPMAGALSDEQITAAARYVSETRSAQPPQTVTGDTERGRQLFLTCGVCHGMQAEGNQAMGGPALRGQNDWYLVTQLGHFRDGNRGSQPGDIYGAQMRASVQMLDDDEAIRDVVAYITILNNE